MTQAKLITIIALALTTSACAMTPDQKSGNNAPLVVDEKPTSIEVSSPEPPAMNIEKTESKTDLQSIISAINALNEDMPETDIDEQIDSLNQLNE